MEKLIELLNEYKKIKGYDWDTKIINYNKNTLSFTNGYSLLDYEIVIWKRYGFIKWLVDNDKIDLKKANNIDNWPLFDYYSDDDALIMALSINNEPLKFLESILK